MASIEFEQFYEGLKNKRIVATQIREIRKSFENWVGSYDADPDIFLEPFLLGKVVSLKVAAPHVNFDRPILFFHAGSYSAGTSWSHRDLLGRLSRSSNREVISIDYRLSPEYPFPAALEDALFAYRLLIAKNGHENISLAGVSAGGGLAMALCLLLKEKKIALPKSIACMSPWVDLTLSGATLESNHGQDLIQKKRLQEAVSMYCEGQDPKNPLISPLYGDFSHFPPVFIQVGKREIFLSEVELLAKKLKNFQVNTTLEIWPEMIHAWQLFAKEFPEAGHAIEKVGDWLNRN